MPQISTPKEFLALISFWLFQLYSAHFLLLMISGKMLLHFLLYALYFLFLSFPFHSFFFPRICTTKITFELNKNNPPEENLRYHFFCFASFPATLVREEEQQQQKKLYKEKERKRLCVSVARVESIIYIFIDFLWLFFIAISGEIISSILFILLFSLSFASSF